VTVVCYLYIVYYGWKGHEEAGVHAPAHAAS
jgi:hypothetical protein